jgi:cob(I)alamin adenosyltransferase
MKIYTKTGDEGATGLIGGKRVRKDDPRIECIGAIDELNASLGLAAAAADTSAMISKLQAVQNELFGIGSQIATPPGSALPSNLTPLQASSATRLETEIDAAEAELTPLREFILPGGSELAARLHLARAVCRRAERLLVTFVNSQPLAPEILIYLNRLSDWLFVQARSANRSAGVPDVPWVK